MTELSHTEIQELLGAYALDAVDGDERDAIELHLRECPRCRTEVAEHREVAALIGHGGAPAPEGIWDRIVESLEPAAPRMRLEVREASAPPDPVVVPFVRPSRARRTIAAAMAAAALVVVGLGGVIVHLDDRVDQVQAKLADNSLQDVATSAWTSSGARQAELRSPNGKADVPAAITSDGQGYLLASSAPVLDSAHTYQLWGVVDNKVISLGTFPGGTRVVPFRVSGPVKELAITEEKAGGVVVSHNPAVYSGTI